MTLFGALAFFRLRTDVIKPVEIALQRPQVGHRRGSFAQQHGERGIKGLHIFVGYRIVAKSSKSRIAVIIDQRLRILATQLLFLRQHR